MLLVLARLEIMHKSKRKRKNPTVCLLSLKRKKKTRSGNTASQGTSLAIVKLRCQYKIATLACLHFEGSLPPYFSSSLCTYEPSRSLRSSNEKLIKIPNRNLKSFKQHSFSFMAPSVWNSLPTTLRKIPTLSQFRSHLKTLFAHWSQLVPNISTDIRGH